MQSSGLSAERRARLVRHFELCMNGHFDQMSLANNNPQPQSAPEFSENSEDVITSSSKRKKTSVQKIFDEDRWSPLQKELVEFIHRLEKFEPIEESSFDFKSYVHRIQLSLMDLLEFKNLTFTGVRHIQERVSAPFFMKYIWAKSAKKWYSSKK